MFLSGTFGLSQGVAIYPTEEMKDEYWSPFRRVTDVPLDPSDILGALEKVAAGFFTKVDEGPSGAGLALTLAVDPTLVTFDMLRTSLSLHLEAIGVPSAGLSSTLDQIQRREMLVKSRGGNVTRFEVTFFLPMSGYTLDQFGRIQTETERGAKAHAERAEAEQRKALGELKADDKRQKLLELKDRSEKDTAIVGAKLETIEERKKTAEREAEIAALRADKERLEAVAREAEERAAAAKRELEAIRAAQAPTVAKLTAEVQEAHRESRARAEENLAGTTEERAEVTRADVQAKLDADVDKQRVEAAAGEALATIQEKLAAEDLKRVEAEARAMVERLAAIPELTAEVARKTPRERAEAIVPLVRPPEKARPARPRARKIEDDGTGRWRDRKTGQFTSAPKTAKKATAKKSTKGSTAKKSKGPTTKRKR